MKLIEKIKQNKKKILFVGAYLLGVAIIFELAMHLLPEKYFQRQYAYIMYELDDVMPFKMRKNVTAYQAYDEFEVQVKTNSLGFRDKEYTVQKPPNTLRVFAMGDSYTYGHGVEQDEIYLEIMEKELNREKNLKGLGVKSVEVINAGGGGRYTTDTQYLFLKTEGVQFDPDITMIGTFVYNDVEEMNSQSNWVEEKNGLPERIVSKNYGVFARKRIWIEVIARYSKLVTKMLDMAAPIRYRTVHREKYEEDLRAMAEHDHFGIFREKLNPDTQRAWNRWKRVVLGMKKIMDKKGGRLIFVILPMDIQVYLDKSSDEAGYAGEDLPISVIKKNLPQKRKIAFFKKHGIEYIDLLPGFKRFTKMDRKVEVFFPIDRHFNVLGQKVTADLVTEYLLRGTRQGIKVAKK